MHLTLKDGTQRLITTSSTARRLVESYKPRRRDHSKAKAVRAERVYKASTVGKTNVGCPRHNKGLKQNKK